MNPTYTVEELIPYLADMRPSLLVVHLSALDNVRKAAAQVGASQDCIVLFDSSATSGEHVNAASAVNTVQDLVNIGHSRKESYKFVEFNLNPGEGKTKVALYFPSSGTTGVPKMVQSRIRRSLQISFRRRRTTLGSTCPFLLLNEGLDREMCPVPVSCSLPLNGHSYCISVQVLPFFRM